MAFVPFTKDEQPTMAAFNEKFSQAIEQAIEQALADGVKIEVGSYVGTGVDASASSPLSITFPFAPKLVANLSGYDEHPIPTAKLNSSGYVSVYNWSAESGSPTKMKISTDGKTIYWYSTYSGAQHEMNTSGTTYYYYGIG